MPEVFKTTKYDDKIAVVNGDKSYSYKEIKGLIARQMRILKYKKNNVVILGGDNFSFIINFFASIFTGKCIYLLTDKNRLKDLDFEYDLLEFSDNGERDEFRAIDIDEKTSIINFYTSGSSGKPKNIQKSLYNLIEEGNDLGKEFNINDDYAVVSTTTMCHLFGMTFHLMFSLCNRLVINTTPIAYPENVNWEKTVLVSTPAFLSTKVKHNLDFGISPKYIISAGSKLDEKVFEALENNSKIIEIYGSTETGVIAYKTKHDEKFNLFPNVEIISGERNVEVKSNYIYGFKTTINDNVELEGRKLTIKNRTDRLFKIYEKRVSAEELEEKLNLHEFVDSSYITCSENKLACMCALSDTGKEFILNNNIYPIIKTLKLHMLQFSEIIPQRWKFIDRIPLNKIGKINKELIEHIFDVNLSLPVIIDRQEAKDSIIYKLFMYKSCNFYNGHFPEFALTPGVVQLYLAKEFANAHFGLNLGQGQIKRVKFSNIIEPDSVIKLAVTKTEKQIMYEYYDDSQKYSSGAFDLVNIFEGENNELV